MQARLGKTQVTLFVWERQQEEIAEVMAASLTELVLPCLLLAKAGRRSLCVLSSFYIAAERCGLAPLLPSLDPCRLESSVKVFSLIYALLL